MQTRKFLFRVIYILEMSGSGLYWITDIVFNGLSKLYREIKKFHYFILK